MKLSSLVLLCGAVVLLTLVSDTHGWWRSSARQAAGGSNEYYFGTTNLNCLLSGGKMKRINKRSAPSRSTVAWKHRWIYYRGYYFEFGIKVGSELKAVYGTSPTAWGTCSTERERSPAGRSNLSLNCIIRCGRSYARQFGKYSFILNNCHKFANKLSDVLYYETQCPSWCT